MPSVVSAYITPSCVDEHIDVLALYVMIGSQLVGNYESDDPTASNV